MKINQVAELTGLTKKNIRFYEEQGLVDPNRDPGNGYREYSLADVEQLKRVKLLRQLGVSCENIRRVKDGSLALDQCLRDRQRELEAESHDLEQMKEMCRMMEDDVDELSAVDASTYLEKMAELGKFPFFSSIEVDYSGKYPRYTFCSATALGHTPPSDEEIENIVKQFGLSIYKNN